MMKLSFILLTISLSFGCSLDEVSSNLKEQSQTLGYDQDSPKVCAAIRGNGDRIFAHFGALGRYHDHYPAFYGVAGGSSGSITTFIYESIKLNPLLVECGDRRCTDEESRLRLAFLLKSMEGYVQAFIESEEVQSLVYGKNFVDSLKEAVNERDFDKLAERDPEQVWQNVEKVFSSSEFTDLINPALKDLFLQSGDIKFHLNQLKASLQTFGDFKANSTDIFFWPGFFDWREFADRIGRIGNFYAGYGNYYPKERMNQLLSDCAEGLKGKVWDDLSGELSTGISCKIAFLQLATEYRVENKNSTVGPNRIDDTIGKGGLSLASTGVLIGSSNIDAYQTAFNQFVQGNKPEFEADFSGLRVGYFGKAGDLERIRANPKNYQDFRTRNFLPIGSPSWRDIISVSPAEPGLSGIIPLNSEQLSVGGWVDLAPVLVLKNAGCDKVVLVTRYVGHTPSGFAVEVAGLLGATDQDIEDLFSTNPYIEPPYSSSLASSEADAVLCTDWDAPAGGQFKAIAKAGFDGRFLTDDPYFTDVQGPHPFLEPSQGRKACLR